MGRSGTPPTTSSIEPSAQPPERGVFAVAVPRARQLGLVAGIESPCPERRGHHCEGDGLRLPAAAGAERRTANEQERSEDEADDRRIDRAPSLRRPVDVAEVQPERELVQCQGRADAEQDPDHFASRTARPERNRDETGAEDEDDSDHHVVQVNASAHAAASPAPDARQARVQPGEREGDEERDQAQDERLLAAEDDLVAVAGNESERVHDGRLRGCP